MVERDGREMFGINPWTGWWEPHVWPLDDENSFGWMGDRTGRGRKEFVDRCIDAIKNDPPETLPRVLRIIGGFEDAPDA